MKKILFILVAMLTSTACAVKAENISKYSNGKSDVVQEYRKQIEICDFALEKKNKASDIQVWQMRNNFSEKFECYNNIINSIIAEHYSKNSDTQLNSNNFINSTIKLSHSIYEDDECYPNCGTMTIEQGQITNLAFLNFYIEQLLAQIESNEKLKRYWEK